MRKDANTKYRQLRAKLIRKGTNITQWAKERGYPATSVYSAAQGYRTGIKSIRILQELEAFTQ